MGSEAAMKRQPHAVCLPCPEQGHITPMPKLTKLLHARGFHITFVNTEFNHRGLFRSRGPDALTGVPGFQFAAIPDSLPPSDADATQDVPTRCKSTSTKCLPHLLALLADLNAPTSGAPPVTCLVVDGVMSFGIDAARAIGVPVASLWTASACGFMGYYNIRNLLDRGLVPFNRDADLADVEGGHLAIVVDGVGARGMCDGVQLPDFPSFIRTTDRDDFMLHFLLGEAERLALPDAVMVNSFEDLEAASLDAMRAVLPPPVRCISPLLLHERQAIPDGSPLAGLGSNLWKEQPGLMEWLDGRAPRSVVYVNYGSITVMTSTQLLEFAWGLANSGYAFVWNIRPDLVRGDSAALPPEFVAAIEGRALLTTWCPQEAVLRHEAVGLVLTHSGWNSTLESLCAGMPMLSWPFFAEQQTNCPYKRTEWGVGMEIGGEVRRDELAVMIREAMDGEKWKKMRRRAMEWKEKVVKATLPGGPAEANLNWVIDEVLLSKEKKVKKPVLHSDQQL